MDKKLQKAKEAYIKQFQKTATFDTQKNRVKLLRAEREFARAIALADTKP